MKTNKSYSKRLKQTRSGKLIGRKSGQDHFNAKASRHTQLAAKRSVNFVMTNKSRSRFILY